MEEKEAAPKLFTPLTWMVTLGATAVFFLFFVIVLPGFVPTENPFWNFFFTVYTATSLTMVFFLAMMAFMAVLNDEKAQPERSHDLPL